MTHTVLWLPIISQQPNRLLNSCQLGHQQHKHSHCSLSLSYPLVPVSAVSPSQSNSGPQTYCVLAETL